MKKWGEVGCCGFKVIVSRNFSKRLKAGWECGLLSEGSLALVGLSLGCWVSASCWAARKNRYF